MAQQSHRTEQQPASPSEPQPAGLRPYSKPTLVARERLSRVTAVDSKVSGITTDSTPSDRRLKDDIRLVGWTFDGLNVYTFRYRNDPVFRMGVMAQEVLPVHPEAVFERNGYLAVDYSRIGTPPVAGMRRDDATLAPSNAPKAATRRPYGKPALVMRERLSQVSADSKVSGVSISDRRLKDDIRLVGRTFDGLNIYTFRYKGDPVVRMGVMAQEVLEVHPEAVGELDGYLAVDYGRIGIRPIEDGQLDEWSAAMATAPQRPYAKPSLLARERLSQVSADTKTSGVVFSDRRLKQDIRLVGRTFDGLDIYTFRYRNDPVVRMGVMAQEVLEVHPEAVGEIDGYLAVDYGRIGHPPVDGKRQHEDPTASSSSPRRSVRRSYSKPSLIVRSEERRVGKECRL